MGERGGREVLHDLVRELEVDGGAGRGREVLHDLVRELEEGGGGEGREESAP